MSTYERIFAALNIADVYKALGREVLNCERINARFAAERLTPPLEKRRHDLLKLAKELRTQVDGLAQRTAVDSTRRIKQQLQGTRVPSRGPTGVEPHLANLIKSRPLAPTTGAVGVADTSELDRAINPNTPGYGPYWRAQEYGTGSHGAPGEDVPSQIGRTIVGFFYEAGGQGGGVRPQAQYAGGNGPHPLFIPSSQRRESGADGGTGGKGTIHHEIKPRHFIRDGANLAAEKWQKEMRRIEERATIKAVKAMAEVGGAISPVGKRRR